MNRINNIDKQLNFSGLNSYGYSVVSVILSTNNKFDITGRPVTVTDAKGREMTVNLFALSENSLLTVNNIDSGKRWLLNDAADKPVRKWDERAPEFVYQYDPLQRPTDTLVNDACTERLVYGTDAEQNNIGQVIESYAQDGKTGFEYDFKGNAITQTKQFAQEYQETLDWNTEIDLSDEVFTIQISFDALSRPVNIINPDETTLYYGYDTGGLLVTVQRNDTEIHISGIEYNEKQQRLVIQYGNNTQTSYEYNPLNFRVTRILTTRPNGSSDDDKLQDLKYEYDAAGNIVEQRDDAQQDFYFANQYIESKGTYKYDALYRLIQATGRELTNLAMPSHEDFANDIPCPNPAANAMQNYTQQYQYDELGNIKKIKSISSSNTWVRHYEYDAG
jgi:YD repeat-containing protein